MITSTHVYLIGKENCPELFLLLRISRESDFVARALMFAVGGRDGRIMLLVFYTDLGEKVEKFWKC